MVFTVVHNYRTIFDLLPLFNEPKILPIFLIPNLLSTVSQVKVVLVS